MIINNNSPASHFAPLHFQIEILNCIGNDIDLRRHHKHVDNTWKRKTIKYKNLGKKGLINI